MDLATLQNQKKVTERRAGTAMRARPSFGMAPTQDIRDLFAKRRVISLKKVTKKLLPVLFSWLSFLFRVLFQGAIVS